MDDGNHIWIDYGADFDDLCPVPVPPHYDTQDLGGIRGVFSSLAGGPEALFPQRQVSFGMANNPWPLREVIDMTRWVGRDSKTKTDIYLGCAFYNFAEGARLISWFDLKMPALIDAPVL
eukprot:Protomagalhaensia_sp_Gyna_25__480@NODE_1227_length_2047_cov_24_102590_g978_i0_p3_GENE_NODE_1227_length_2047_cov_24_102590_g978_i0NODE_1227_length_2047_cov_24_102590_g978_i0_p3_ORF_typecomplete_len119_score22_53_NODE_1227_length_2047_cov_24_102590_g978_i0311667